MTIDVEDWFQVENFKACIPCSSWPNRELRVEKNTHSILDMLDSRSIEQGRPRATFFILGWIAQRLPHLVREICARGHEVASHGFHHRLCRDERGDALREDLVGSKRLLEDTTGLEVRGYRAPSFSVDSNVLRIIEESGYQYDSSFNSFGMHDRYGKVDFSAYKNKGIAVRISDSFYEVPISNLELSGFVVPWGGGGYFRLLPSPIFQLGVQAILRKKGAYVFYLHPWEVDPDQPLVPSASSFYRFRHYLNLGRTMDRFSLFIDSFRNARFPACYEYLAMLDS